MIDFSSEFTIGNIASIITILASVMAGYGYIRNAVNKMISTKIKRDEEWALLQTTLENIATELKGQAGSIRVLNHNSTYIVDALVDKGILKREDIIQDTVG